MNSQLGRGNTFEKDINIIVPPVAVVDLNPNVPTCKVPYLAPNNAAPAYEGMSRECQNLPTGDYDLIVFHGFAGGTSSESPVFPDADSGPIYSLENATFTGQVWTVPNELGAVDSDYELEPVSQLPIDQQIESQGPLGRFTISDESASNDARSGCDQAIDIIDGSQGYRDIQLVPVDELCVNVESQRAQDES